ncbi:MAG: hypothetical protein M1828_002296 [Chrysothrix sp. TS-e1954]|nr:MAG: hypothetical protein M1828_002296 [Chrysothrix sp. TS-e1954]
MSSSAGADSFDKYDCVDTANFFDRNDFFTKYVRSPLLKIALPGENLYCEFETSMSINTVDLEACFSLVEQTSGAAYKASNIGWSSSGKRQEMKDPNMKFLLIRTKDWTGADETRAPPLQGFLQFMITMEDDMKVVYCYEVHLRANLQGQRIGQIMMQAMETIGEYVGVEKAMLTVFVSNERAIRFYNRIGD